MCLSSLPIITLVPIWTCTCSHRRITPIRLNVSENILNSSTVLYEQPINLSHLMNGLNSWQACSNRLCQSGRHLFVYITIECSISTITGTLQTASKLIANHVLHASMFRKTDLNNNTTTRHILNFWKVSHFFKFWHSNNRTGGHNNRKSP